MSTTAQNDLQLAPVIPATLQALRRRIRQYVWLEGCALLVVWLGAAFWGSLLVDWFFEPPAAVRVLLLTAVAAVFAAIAFQQIARRSLTPLSDRNMAMVLERRFPVFADSLLTAVVLSERGADAAECNAEMLARTCATAQTHIQGLRLLDVFNLCPAWRASMAAALLMISIAFYAALWPNSLSVWARRSLCLSSELWPRNTRLLVDGFPHGMRKAARGSDVDIIARADLEMPQVPQTVEVRYRTEGGGRGRATMERHGIAHPPLDRFQQYAHTFHSVLGDIHFDVVGGDDRVRDCWIHVVDRPKISAMTLACKLPDYIGRTQPPLPVTGVMELPQGADITVQAVTNKVLQQVSVAAVVGDQPGPIRQLAADDIAADRRSFRYAVGPLNKETTLLFTLTDTDDIKSRDPVRLVLAPVADQPPQLALQLDGIGSAVTPQARIPAVGRITDDYGIARAWFEYAADQQLPGSRPIALPAAQPTDLHVADAAIEVRDLKLAPGQKLLVCVKAADRCTLSAAPNVGSSERWPLDVVAPEQLRSLLESRELVLRQQFERTVQEMTETRDLLARLSFAPPAAAPTDAPAADADSKAEHKAAAAEDSVQQQSNLRLLRIQGALLNSRKTEQEVLGMAEAFSDIRKQLINNRIDTEELKNRLQAGIADPLHAIAGQMLPELERRIDRLQAVVDNPQTGPELRDQAQQQADDILLAMRKVLDRMLVLEDFNQAVELLRDILKAQQELRTETQQRHKQTIRDLLQE